MPLRGPRSSPRHACLPTAPTKAAGRHPPAAAAAMDPLRRHPLPRQHPRHPSELPALCSHKPLHVSAWSCTGRSAMSLGQAQQVVRLAPVIVLTGGLTHASNPFGAKALGYRPYRPGAKSTGRTVRDGAHAVQPCIKYCSINICTAAKDCPSLQPARRCTYFLAKLASELVSLSQIPGSLWNELRERVFVPLYRSAGDVSNSSDSSSLPPGPPPPTGYSSPPPSGYTNPPPVASPPPPPPSPPPPPPPPPPPAYTGRRLAHSVPVSLQVFFTVQLASGYAP